MLLAGYFYPVYSCRFSVGFADEAPPPPPSTEKPSPPPQQHEHDGAAHSKAVPAYAATSPLAPTAAVSPSAPQPPHSASSSQGVSCAAVFIIIIAVILWGVGQN
jgi:hypothetical protein